MQDMKLQDVTMPDGVSSREKTNRCTGSWCTASCEPQRRAHTGSCTLQVIADSEDDEDEQATAAASAASAAASHSTDVDDICEVCLVVPRTGVALVPCEQAPCVLTLSLPWATAVRSADHG